MLIPAAMGCKRALAWMTGTGAGPKLCWRDFDALGSWRCEMQPVRVTRERHTADLGPLPVLPLFKVWS